MAFTREGNNIIGTQNGESINLTSDYYSELTVYAGGGNDTVYGTVLSDTIYGGDGNDALYAISGITPYPRPFYWPDENKGDTIYGEAGNDFLGGSDSKDFLYGGTGNDTLNGGEGGDFLSGGEGDDTYLIDTRQNARGSDAGPDIIDEMNGGGDDLLIFSNLKIDEINLKIDIENSSTDLWLSSFDDLADNQNNSGVIIKDFFTLENGEYAFNDSNVIENIGSKPDDVSINLISALDLVGINEEYNSLNSTAVEIA